MRFDNLPEPRVMLSSRGSGDWSDPLDAGVIVFDDTCRPDWWGVDLATKPDQSLVFIDAPGLRQVMERAWRDVAVYGSGLIVCGDFFWRLYRGDRWLDYRQHHKAKLHGRRWKALRGARGRRR